MVAGQANHFLTSIIMSAQEDAFKTQGSQLIF